MTNYGVLTKESRTIPKGSNEHKSLCSI